ncbi:MAG TPA: quinone-dependent dihydroorotate dehydrogenase [Polyangiaceae bacterium]|jgi:dihydroorotate dehydrogenase|nr:quinone-dependent dihydroorotate dehydrogenase [Polyangiaceae bacterium]
MYRWLIRPLLFWVPAEWAHTLTFAALRWLHALPGGPQLLRAIWGRLQPGLEVHALGLRFASPVVLAAGFDKHATGYAALLDLGFGGVEVGTITNEAQAGNPRPRLFRLPHDRALLNRMGFNNCGAEQAERHLRAPRQGVVGVNIGKTKRVAESEAVVDYAASARRLAPLADYLVVNVSSPNTPGLRDLQAAEKLRPLLKAVQAELRGSAGRRPALLVKIAPDLADEDILGVADLALELGLDGIVATNTTISRAGLRTPPHAIEALGAGGISGAPLRQRSLEVLRLLRSRAGSRLTLVAAGGIDSADEAWARLCAGASLVQIYTAFIYGGPSLPGRIAQGLLERARAEGFATLAKAIEYHHSEPAVGAGGPRALDRV